jgi:hypothetical protein
MRLLLAVFLLAGATSLLRAAAPPVSEIVKNVVARDEAQQKELAQYAYHQRVRTEKLNPDGTVRSASEIVMTVHSGDDFTIVADGSGNVLAPTQVTDRQRKEARDSEKLKASFSLRRLAGRFDIAMKGEATVAGKAAWVVAFTPRPDQPFRNRIEKILNNLAGTMWIAQDDYSILRTEAKLVHPVDMAWFFATMENLNYSYRANPSPDGTPPSLRPAEFDVTFDIDVMTRQIRQRQAISMSDYRLP